MSRVYQANIPTYPGGHWLLVLCQRAGSDGNYDAKRWLSLGIETRYYNPELHVGSFALPTYVNRLLEKGEILDDVFKRVIQGQIWPPDHDRTEKIEEVVEDHT